MRIRCRLRWSGLVGVHHAEGVLYVMPVPFIAIAVDYSPAG